MDKKTIVIERTYRTLMKSLEDYHKQPIKHWYFGGTVRLQNLLRNKVRL